MKMPKSHLQIKFQLLFFTIQSFSQWRNEILELIKDSKTCIKARDYLLLMKMLDKYIHRKAILYKDKTNHMRNTNPTFLNKIRLG